jgi:hypothetical protein
LTSLNGRGIVWSAAMGNPHHRAPAAWLRNRGFELKRLDIVRGIDGSVAFDWDTSMKFSLHHTIWMLVGCVLPFLALFLLPAFGLNDSLSIAAFFVLMIGCHLMHRAISGTTKKESHHAEAESNEDR